MKKLLAAASSTLFLFLFLAGSALASEGDIDLKNQVGSDSQCLARSVYISGNFQIPFTCINITYPSGAYVAWAQPVNGGNAIRLGNLEFGKVIFKTNTQFSRLYVTLEQQNNPRTPTGPVIMSGNVTPFRFDSPVRDTTGENNSDNELLSSSPTPIPSVPTEPGATNNVFRTLAVGGVLTFLALFGIILIIFVISRR